MTGKFGGFGMLGDSGDGIPDGPTSLMLGGSKSGTLVAGVTATAGPADEAGFVTTTVGSVGRCRVLGEQGLPPNKGGC